METGKARWHERAGVFASAALLIVLFGLLLTDVILRWLHVEFYWGSEGGGLLMAWMIFLALPMVMRTRGHIATDFVVAHLPDGVKAVLRMAGHVLMIAYLPTGKAAHASRAFCACQCILFKAGSW